MNDSYETKAALLAAKENSDLPVLVSNAYEQGGRLMMGTTPAALVAMLEGLGVDAIGANCSFGPKQLAAVAAQLVKHASVPVFVKPNAGLPQMTDGKVTYDVAADVFADEVADMLQGGVRMCGGCCGTTPAHIAALTARTAGMTPVATAEKTATVIATSGDIFTLGEDETVVSYHLTAAENEEFAAALADEDMDYVTDEAVDQQDEGADLLAVSVAADGIDEAAALKKVVCALQAAVRMPLLLLL
jgi:5-methyltetrahydrofolate--homocysteine methyltransferase